MCNYTISNDKNIHDMAISSELALSCKASHSRDVSYMKSNAEKNVVDSKGEK